MTIPNEGEREPLRRVSVANPCPICQHSDWCSIGPDGRFVICMRAESNAPAKNGGSVHRLVDPVQPPAKQNERTCAPKDWNAEASRYAAALTSGSRNDRCQTLAGTLGLPPDALDALPLLGFSADDPAGPCFTFAEADAAGSVIGLTRRFRDGSKKAMHGGKRGLTLPKGWCDRPGPVFVVEGPTDVAAMTAAGLSAVGRPSNSGGVALLVQLLRDLDLARQIVVVGENDRKQDGAWPGRTGAESVARRLAEALHRSVIWALPPAGSKDVRDWLTASTRAATTWPARGAELLAHFTATAATINPPDPPPNAVPIDGPNDAPDNPHRLAAQFLDSITPAGSPRVLRYWRDEFHRYDGSAYRAVRGNDLRGQLTTFVRSEFVRANRDDRAAWQTAGGKGGAPKVRPVTSSLIENVLQALRGLCLLSASVDAPAWIDGETGPDPVCLLPMRNGILDLNGAATNRPTPLLPPTPRFFTTTAAPFDFGKAAPPQQWLRFLSALWPDDPEGIDALQEWFGYLLTADTRQQKILFLLGPRRSGKGTIARVLRELVGTANVAGPTLGGLATPFGLSSLLGRSVAIISDARLSGRSDSAVITERLLSISGEDTLTVDRKHRDPLEVKLNTRFVIMSNELPRLGDASGALVGRFILLRLTESFYGREDPQLFERLRGELPGILSWAIEGWRRLTERGRFVQPASGAELVSEVEDLSSPVGAFVRERCRVRPNDRVEVSALYAAWRAWCDRHGRKEPGTEETFGRDLRAAVPTLKRTRPRSSEGRPYVYVGIGLRGDTEEPPLPPPGPSGRSDQPLHAEKTKYGSALHAKEERRKGDTMAGRCDRPDHPRLRFVNDDRLHEWRE